MFHRALVGYLEPVSEKATSAHLAVILKALKPGGCLRMKENTAKVAGEGDGMRSVDELKSVFLLSGFVDPEMVRVVCHPSRGAVRGFWSWSLSAHTPLLQAAILSVLFGYLTLT